MGFLGEYSWQLGKCTGDEGEGSRAGRYWEEMLGAALVELETAQGLGGERGRITGLPNVLEERMAGVVQSMPSLLNGNSDLESKFGDGEVVEPENRTDATEVVLDKSHNQAGLTKTWDTAKIRIWKECREVEVEVFKRGRYKLVLVWVADKDSLVIELCYDNKWWWAEYEKKWDRWVRTEDRQDEDCPR